MKYNTTHLHKLKQQLTEAKEKQRMAGVRLADWIKFRRKTNDSKLDKFINREIERIDEHMKVILETQKILDDELSGMSPELREMVINEDCVY